MAMTASHRRSAGTAVLPLLEIPPEHEAIRQATPPNLNGLQYSHLPDVGATRKYGTNNKSREQPVVLLPNIGEPHPYPYVVTAEVQLTGSHEETFVGLHSVVDDDEFEDAALYFLMEVKFSKGCFRDDILPSLLRPDLVSIAEEVTNKKLGSDERRGVPALAAASAADPTDAIATIPNDDGKEARGENDPSDALLEEVAMLPHVETMCREVLWEVIDERARNLTTKQIDEMNQRAEQLRLDPTLCKTIVRKATGRTNEPEEEEKLNAVKAERVLFEYQRVISKQRLTENFALKVFQDKIISNALDDKVVEDAFQSFQKDVDTMDAAQRKLQPPR